MIDPRSVKGELTFTFLRPPDRRLTITAQLLEAGEERIVMAHRLSGSRPTEFFGEPVMAAGYLVVWFLFKDQPFDVGRVYRPDGRWTGYYVDVLEPVTWAGADPASLAPITDLFLDLWIAPDGRYLILDEDEFQAAARQGHLTADQIRRARSVLTGLVEAIQRGAFPPAVVRAFQLPAARGP